MNSSRIAISSQEKGERLLQLGVVCELNSAFLHLRALMRLLGWTWEHPLYRRAWDGVWLTFATLRIGAHGGMAVLLWSDPHGFVEDSGIGMTLAGMIVAGLISFLAFDAALGLALRGVMAADIRRVKNAAQAPS